MINIDKYAINKIICNTLIERGEEGGRSYSEKNIVFEYDEPKHYKDVYNNILSDKDIIRQNNIINKLHCQFWRYNERLDKLYQVM